MLAGWQTRTSVISHGGTHLVTDCCVPTVGASVARHNYKKILFRENINVYCGNNRNSGTSENRNARHGYGSDIKYLTLTLT